MTQPPTLTIETPDPARSAGFYRALGFTEIVREPDRVELDAGGVRLSVLRAANAANAAGAGAVDGARPAATPGSSLQLTVQADLESLRPALLAAGGAEVTDVESDWSGAIVTDPDGNPVRLLPPVVVTTPAATAPAATAPAVADTTAGAADAGPGSGGSAAGPPTAAPTTPPTGTPTNGQTAPAPAATSVAPAVDEPDLPRSPLPAAYYNEHGVPTFDAVAERIHHQAATADGNEILDAESQRGRAESDTMDKLKRAGKDRLDQLRRSMGG